ncbi:hypothetical protein SADUNF_Sadunf16G0082000 [Salix dunnii]|uniref:Uncharacterized protein n=1 Tax=Salix dunnii TaxID=1413687 RepID=A0A835J7M9_9ROSI|nr:hypothetical protein SADUNF_Sadunf16G0082000 [Salix dunnii]
MACLPALSSSSSSIWICSLLVLKKKDAFIIAGAKYSTVVVGLILCTWAAITVPGIFLSIHPHSDDNRFVDRSLG